MALNLFAHVMAPYGIGKETSILDVGTRIGANLKLSRDFGFASVEKLDFSEEAIQSFGAFTLAVAERRTDPYGF